MKIYELYKISRPIKAHGRVIGCFIKNFRELNLAIEYCGKDLGRNFTYKIFPSDIKNPDIDLGDDFYIIEKEIE